jgi:hypothetical protein
MSALGQKQTWHSETVMSAIPPKADIHWYSSDVRFVPNSDIALEYAQLKFLNIGSSLGARAGPSSASKEDWRPSASSSRAADDR